MQQSARRNDRIAHLEQQRELTEPESKELRGLLAKGLHFEENYRVHAFTAEHQAFKARHNDVFFALAKYCSGQGEGDVGGDSDVGVNLFYLDGPDAGTTLSLIEAGVRADQCFVANRHAATCEAIVTAGLPASNVAHAWAADALRCGRDDSSEGAASCEAAASAARGSGAGAFFGGVEFGAFYFDGCGGYAPVITEMAAAALQPLPPDSSLRPTRPVALGFSLVGGNRDVVDKELEVNRAVLRLGRAAGFRSVVHCLEDPGRFGLTEGGAAPPPRKVEGGTLTTWLLLEPHGWR